MKDLIPAERIKNKIYLIRRQKVMLDFDLACLYGVETRMLIQAVKRNLLRFPSDFMFQLNKEEYNRLRSQFVILKKKEIIGSKRGKHAKYLPYAFTEQGIAMLSSVLRSKRAIQVNVQIMRTFVRLKKILLTYKGVAEKLKELEKKYEKHNVEIKVIFDAIRQVMLQPEAPKKRIGFNV